MPSEDSEGNTVIMSKLSEKNESVAAMHFFCRHDDERRQAGFAVHAVLACMHAFQLSEPLPLPASCGIGGKRIW